MNAMLALLASAPMAPPLALPLALPLASQDALVLPTLDADENVPTTPAPLGDELDLAASLETLFGFDWEASQACLAELKRCWQPNFSTALVEFLRVSYHLRQPGFRSTCFGVIGLLEEQNGVSLGADVSAWFQWIWSAGYDPHPQSMQLKSQLYRRIDPKFARYFEPGRESHIALDEVRWGGVLQDGIPPLRNPKMLSAEEASYLEDEHVVYGIEVDGDARAYPKRILAWHEMFTDKVGGLEVTGVF